MYRSIYVLKGPSNICYNLRVCAAYSLKLSKNSPYAYQNKNKKKHVCTTIHNTHIQMNWQFALVVYTCILLQNMHDVSNWNKLILYSVLECALHVCTLLGDGFNTIMRELKIRSSEIHTQTEWDQSCANRNIR